MRLLQMPEMMFSENVGWNEVRNSPHDVSWYRTRVVLPMSLLPPLLYAYAETLFPGAVFILDVPPPTALELFLSCAVFYVVEIIMVAYMAMLIQRIAMARDHDPGYANAYALAAIAPIPLWLSSVALLIPSRGLAVGALILAWFASAALIRQGTRPILGIGNAKTAHFVSTVATATGFVAWIGLLIVASMLLSVFLGTW